MCYLFFSLYSKCKQKMWSIFHVNDTLLCDGNTALNLWLELWLQINSTTDSATMSMCKFHWLICIYKYNFRVWNFTNKIQTFQRNLMKYSCAFLASSTS